MNLKRFWNIIHSAENNLDTLPVFLDALNRREMWLFYEIFRLEHWQILHGTHRSQLKPQFPTKLTPFAKLINQKFMEHCICDDETGIAAYPDAVITDWTWNIIRRAEKDSSKLHVLLKDCSRDELFRFHDEFKTAAGILIDERFKAPPELAHSEDGMIYRSHWIVTQGKEYYVNVWENPETFPHKFGHDRDHRKFFFTEAEDLFEERFGKDIWYFNPFTGIFLD